MKKPIIIYDLHERVRKTLEKRRQPTYRRDEAGNLIKDFPVGFELFEFLIFLEIRNSKGSAVLHHPIAIGHETGIEKALREQLTAYSCLLPDYSAAVIAIENSFTKFEEWDLFNPYAAAEESAKAIAGNLGGKLKKSKNQLPDYYCRPIEEKDVRAFYKNIVREQTIEVIRFLRDEDSEPLPLVVSVSSGLSKDKTTLEARFL